MTTHGTGGRAAEQLIRGHIRARGPITFAEFMAIALHDPELGYFAARPPIGASGDYYTSPELHPAFAVLLGQQVEQLWQALDRPRPFVVYEAGPGSGRFARDLLDWVRSTCPELYGTLDYRLDELSPTLRAQQRRLLAQAGHSPAARWVHGFDHGARAHLIFANELLDALPVHLVQVRSGRLEELFVQLDDERLRLKPGPPSTPALEAHFEHLGVRPAEGCRAEVNLAALAWMRAAGGAIGRGLLLVLDYGYPAEVLYAPTRYGGTLLCYYRHTLSSDPLARVGQQDITSHVDFTRLRQAGETAGLATLGLVSQRRLLANLGWGGLRTALSRLPLGPAERGANERALDALVDPSGLGRILALVQQRGLDRFAPYGLVGGSLPRWDDPPLRRADHLRLPDPAEAEGLLDFEAQWSEFWTESP